MEVLTREKIVRGQIPSGAHVLELVADRAECALHPHFAGMECVPVSRLETLSDRYRTEEPILIHCVRPERCETAAAELDRMGYTNLYRYEGDLEDLRPYFVAGVGPEAGYAAPQPTVETPVIVKDELEELLEERGDAAHLFHIVRDESSCPAMMVGVTCMDAARFEAEGLEDISIDDTVVLRCEPGLDCQRMARAAFDQGFDDVRLFEGDYKDVSWLSRM